MPLNFMVSETHCQNPNQALPVAAKVPDQPHPNQKWNIQIGIPAWTVAAAAPVRKGICDTWTLCVIHNKQKRLL